MSIETPEELAGLRAAGRAVAETLRAMRRAVRPGVTTASRDVTAELDGFYADACVTVPVGRPRPDTVRLLTAARRLNEGLVMMIEPIVSAGPGDVALDRGDGGTVSTGDGSPSAHAEHTLVITRGRPLALTA